MKNRKPQPSLFENYKWITFAILLLTVTFVYFVPKAIMYPEYAPIGWIVFVIIFFIIPILLLITLKAFVKHSPASMALAIGSVLVIGPTFGIFQQYREKVELQKLGSWTKAVVIDHKIRYDKIGTGWMVKCQYKVNQIAYQTSYHSDDQNKFAKGDTLNIIYSREFPRVYALDYEWEK